MTAITTYTRERTRDICIANVAIGERMHKPTEKQIDEMAESLHQVGQLTPIIVHPVTRQSWRIVAGNTRLLAAFKLKWTHLRADIICGQQVDYRIIELTENAERRSLTAAQRRAAKAELKKLIREKLASVEGGKGGRGNKGGINEAARELGMSKATVHRAAKPSQTTGFETVSSPPSNGGDHPAPSPPRKRPGPPPTPMREPISIRFTVAERDRVERYNKERYNNGAISTCLRNIVNKALDDEKYT